MTNNKPVRLSAAINLREPQTTPPAPTKCPACGNILAPLALPSGRWIKPGCQCQRQLRLMEEHRLTQRERQEKLKLLTYGWLEESSVQVSRLASLSFANFDPSKNLRSFQACLAFSKRAEGNLIVYGPYGVGKTHLLAAICNALREQNIASRFLVATEFLRLIQSRPELALGLIAQAKQTKFLVIDDVDKVPPTETRESTYNDILNYRYNQRLPTAVSTNKIAEIGKHIGLAALSRLQNGLVPVEMVGSDQRRGGL